MEWPYPAIGTEPWFSAFTSFVLALDASSYASREDRQAVLARGGRIEWDHTTGLTWDDEIWLTAPITGFSWRLAANLTPLVIGEGQVLYAVLNRGTLQNATITPVVANLVPSTDDAILFAIRIGNDLFWRNSEKLATGTILTGGFGSGSVTLGQAYSKGNVIPVTSADGSPTIQNSADTTDLLTLARTFVGAGDLITFTRATGATGRDLVGTRDLKFGATADDASGDQVLFDFAGTVDKAAGAYTGIKLDVLETTAPGGGNLIDLKVGGVSQWTVDNTGTLIVGSIGGASFTLQNAYDGGGEAVAIAAGTPIALTTSGVGQQGLTVYDGADTLVLLGSAIQAPTGTLGAPSYTFVGDPTKGFYDGGTDTVSVALQGALRYSFTNDAIIPTGTRHLGSATNPWKNAYADTVRAMPDLEAEPSFTWNVAPTTGFWFSSPAAVDTVNVSTQGTTRASWSSLAYTTTVPMLAPDGAVGATAFGFSSDPAAGGMYLSGTDVKIAAGGVDGILVDGSRVEIARSSFYLTAGSAAAPSLSGVGDINTGLYWTDDDTFNVSTGGERVMSLGPHDAPDASGQVAFVDFDFDPSAQASAPDGWTGIQFNAVAAGGGSGTKSLIDLQVGGTSQWTVDSSGTLVTGTVPAAALPDPILLSDGIEAAPAYSFSGYNGHGMWVDAGGNLSFSVYGTERFKFNSTGQMLMLANGTAAAPSFSWVGIANAGIDTGMYYSAPGGPPVDTVHISTGGVERASWAASLITQDVSGTSVGTFTLAELVSSGDAGAEFVFERPDTNPFTGLRINMTGNSTGFSTPLLIQRGGTNVFWVHDDGNVAAADGNAAFPGYTFVNETGVNSGMYRISDGVFGFSSNSAAVMQISAGQVQFVDGAVGTPSMAFITEPDTGFYLESSGTTSAFSAVANGSEVARFRTNASNYEQLLVRGDNGAGATRPPIASTNDDDTGIYWPAPDNLGFAVGNAAAMILDRALNDDDDTAVYITPSVNQSTTEGYRGIHLNVTETALGDATATLGGYNRLLDLGVGGTTLWAVDNVGTLATGYPTVADVVPAAGTLRIQSDRQYIVHDALSVVATGDVIIEAGGTLVIL
jgi:hypothetical protein